MEKENEQVQAVCKEKVARIRDWMGEGGVQERRRQSVGSDFGDLMQLHFSKLRRVCIDTA